MSPHSHSTNKKTVAESGFHFLHIQLVEYYLRGGGAKVFDIPVDAEQSSAQTTTSKSTQSSSGDAVLLASKRKRIESLGHEIGTKLVERFAHDHERLEHDLDMVKFICKDFWEAVFNKQVDILRTNHRGLYVLTDNQFRWLSSVSLSPHHPGSPEDYVVFPCGLVCGALTRLGVKCRVTAEIIPQPLGFKCSFNVQVIQN